MSHEKTSRTAQHRLASLKDLRDRIAADETPSYRERRDLLSAIDIVARWFGIDLTAIPAHRPFLRQRFRQFHPTQLRRPVSRKTVANVRTNLNRALKRYGFGDTPRLAPLAPEWLLLWKQLPDSYARNSLARLIRWASA